MAIWAAILAGLFCIVPTARWPSLTLPALCQIHALVDDFPLARRGIAEENWGFVWNTTVRLLRVLA